MKFHNLKVVLLSFLIVFSFLSIGLNIFSQNSFQISSTFSPASQLAQVSSTLNDGLVAHYTFDEGTGVTAGDSTGGNTGTLSGSTKPTWVLGKINGALDFTNGSAVTTGLDSIGAGGASISFWINERTAGQITAFILDNGKTIIQYDGGHGSILFSSDGVTRPRSAIGSVSYGSWYHVVVTRDASGLANFYVNGSLSGTPNQPTGTPLAGTGSVKIGNSQNQAHAIDGTLDDVRIYNRVLSPSEVSDLYSYVDSGPGASPATPTVPTSPTQPSSPSALPTPSAPTTVTAVRGVYTVNSAGGTNTFTTIQACADVATAGETCNVQPGTYNEKVTPKNSGNTNGLITFVASGTVKMRGFALKNRNYIKISGFEITNLGLTTDPGYAGINLEFSSFNQIINNTLHDGMRECIRMRDLDPGSQSNNNIIRGNTLYKCGSQNTSVPGGGIYIFGNNNLVENNDISHLGEDFTRVTGGDYNVIRNNVFHDNSLTDWSAANATHIDGMQNWCATLLPVSTRYLLIENNQQYNTPSHDTHFVIYQNYGNCDQGNLLVRYNNVKNLGDYILINDVKTPGVRLYNNTFSQTSISSTKPWNAVEWLKSSTGGKLINNIFNDTVRPGGYPYAVDATSASGFDAHNNLAYIPGNNGTWRSPTVPEIGAVFNKDPNTGAGTDAGGYLTRVSTSDAGSGTAFVVDDAGMFQTGWAGVDSDWISVGVPANYSKISSINYETNTIHLSSSLSRKPGDSVWLFKDSSGRQVLFGTAPDIGANEVNSGSVSATPVILPPSVPTLPSTPTPPTTPRTSPVSPTTPITKATPVVPSTTVPPTTPKPLLSPAITKIVYNFGTVTLRLGSKGEAVKELQRFLNDNLNLGLVLDGKFGPKTNIVIKKWQTDHALVVDGLVGNKTKAKMNGLTK